MRARWARVQTGPNSFDYYKSCPACYRQFGREVWRFAYAQVGLSYPNTARSEYGLTDKRMSGSNPYGIQSLCGEHRRGKGASASNAGLVLPANAVLGKFVQSNWK